VVLGGANNFMGLKLQVERCRERGALCTKVV
jgi:hypothetical protein